MFVQPNCNNNGVEGHHHHCVIRRQVQPTGMVEVGQSTVPLYMLNGNRIMPLRRVPHRVNLNNGLLMVQDPYQELARRPAQGPDQGPMQGPTQGLVQGPPPGFDQPMEAEFNEVDPSPGSPMNFASCEERFNGIGDVRPFINAVIDFKICSEMTDQSALRSFPLLLTDQAAAWFQDNKTKFTDWDNVIELLRIAYSPRMAPHEIYQRFFSSPQRGESTEAFIHRSMALLRRLPENTFTKETELDLVYAMLSNRIKEKVAREDCYSFTDLMDRAWQAEIAIAASIPTISQVTPQYHIVRATAHVRAQVPAPQAAAMPQEPVEHQGPLEQQGPVERKVRIKIRRAVPQVPVPQAAAMPQAPVERQEPVERKVRIMIQRAVQPQVPVPQAAAMPQAPVEHQGPVERQVRIKIQKAVQPQVPALAKVIAPPEAVAAPHAPEEVQSPKEPQALVSLTQVPPKPPAAAAVQASVEPQSLEGLQAPAELHASVEPQSLEGLQAPAELQASVEPEVLKGLQAPAELQASVEPQSLEGLQAPAQLQESVRPESLEGLQAPAELQASVEPQSLEGLQAPAELQESVEPQSPKEPQAPQEAGPSQAAGAPQVPVELSPEETEENRDGNSPCGRCKIYGQLFERTCRNLHGAEKPAEDIQPAEELVQLDAENVNKMVCARCRSDNIVSQKCQKCTSVVSNSCPMINVNIYDMDFNIIVDTGSHHSIASVDLMRHLIANGQNFILKLLIMPVMGVPTRQIYRVATVDVVAAGVRIPTVFIEMPGANRTLFGMDFVQRAGLVMDFRGIGSWNVREGRGPDQAFICEQLDRVQ